ncbi:class I SAM-dependent methyltransferase [Rufibacter sediminis]|uniref:Class I SAM-dependent methyltransferase n=1 Tax=Rufibacter sediminis TaxID=2762756 RepID=A0ABR6VMH9_9BACT|nr:class I SAM-dependent methyltransferase [Rufibacter sediminis]MBC3538377.1 class I SAM-dependent methyltransferase [Rufibacter sediminis]
MSSPSVPDFNCIAPVYDALAQLVYGDAQKRAQAHFLSLIPAGARVLVLGGGSGWILTELLRQSAPVHVLYLEPARNMLQQAQNRFRNTSSTAQVEFRLGTELDLTPQETFHVVLTPFVLDLFPAAEAYAMMQRLSQALLPGGLWLHTDFHASAPESQPVWQKLLLWGMYRFFGVVSNLSARELPPFEALFQKIGFKTHREAFYFRKFIRAQVLQKAVF